MDRYAGVVMLLTVLVNGALLAEAANVCGHALFSWRWFIGAAVSGGYAILCLKTGLTRLGAMHWRVGVLIAIGFIAYGCVIKKIIVFLLLSFAMDGVVIGIGNGNVWMMIPSMFMILLLCAIAFRHTAGEKRYVPVELQFRGVSVRLRALRDTGHSLRDPITGMPVLVLDSAISQKLTGLNRKQLSQPVEVMRKPPFLGLRLIPYQTIGQSDGLLLGMRMPSVRIGNWNGCLMVAFAPEEFCNKGEFQALTGGST